MKASEIIILVAIVFLLGIYCFFLYDDPGVRKELSVAEIMEIIKTDKDYAELSEFIKDFDPQIVSYAKLGPAEYNKIKPEWREGGFEERIKIVDRINLNNFCYWVEIKNKNNQNQGLRMILDAKQKKSLLLMASLSISAGVGI